MSLRRVHTTTTPRLTPKGNNLLVPPLVDSPLPSPVLPSIVPSHGKRPPGSGKRKVIRLLFWGLATLSFVKIFLLLDFGVILNFTHQWLADNQAYRPSDLLPDIPSPIKLKNSKGRQKWTISIPTDMKLPLSPPQISDLCSRCITISGQLSSGKSHPFDHSPIGDNQIPICETSLTFAMQSEDAGLGKTLMDLWMSYGLARKQGRSFFIDDTDWAYGKFSSFFKPPPRPACRLPPPSQRVPCPLQARHLIVSSANSNWIFGENFKEHFQSSRSTAAEQQKAIFDMARNGYEALFHLTGDDAKFLEQRVRELNRDIRYKGGLEIGLHVRRGDLHPLETQYRDSYIPLDKYVNRAEALFETHLSQAAGDKALQQSMQSYSRIILASDDPDIYTTSELKGAEKAQSYISLASKSVLDSVRETEDHSFGENIGWEGGFFKDLFWSVGISNSYSPKDSPLPSNKESSDLRMDNGLEALLEKVRFQPSKEILGLRELIGRAYLLDLAVLGQSDRVICGIGSTSCRLLAVMMGWERAVIEKAWQNVDGIWDWTYRITT
ncbi:hypothetical protein BGW36DRAFT_294444 [Talaromyces proteolyticus]|uniref:Uncharacterized protein n=1 Tax=Talaromyces proteolyticus TaxID=1131652 RepID=A0AAD4KQH5_9EURO|nr:uncharacterized protein BGW36DRAFT_294444 [Talaromyces proteolyticus]KAH8698255.1 hypothetical protein BGW36DRAFT_294444 [Talaromyces proteolyticus]